MRIKKYKYKKNKLSVNKTGCYPVLKFFRCFLRFIYMVMLKSLYLIGQYLLGETWMILTQVRYDDKRAVHTIIRSETYPSVDLALREREALMEKFRQ